MTNLHTSVVICTYNMAPYLPFALHSVANQRCDGYEILVIDDGSTDDTPNILKDFNSHFPIRTVRNFRNEGLSFCRNLALREAKGEYLSVLDADDMLSPDKVGDHATVLSDNKDVGVVWGRTLLLKQGVEGYFPSIRPESDFKMGWDLVSPYEVSHSATTWRKSALVRAGGYDPDRVLVEAPDLFLKLGDFCAQEFVPRVAAIKRVFQENTFRKVLTPEKRQELSRLLFRETIHRRYSLTTDNRSS